MPNNTAEWMCLLIALPWVVIIPYFVLAPLLPWVLERFGIDV